MIELAGTWFDGKTSKQKPAKLLAQENGQYRIVTDHEIHQGLVRELKVSARLGNTPRRLVLTTGAAFETSDNDAVDHLLGGNGDNKLHRLLHGLESRWGVVIIFTGATGLLVWLFLLYGLPAMGRGFAYAMPAKFLENTDEQTLLVLDSLYFKASALSEPRQNELRQRLLAATPKLEVPVRVEFRQGARLGANAFALPGGTVVFTDELVNLASADEQIEAVYGHELGHLVHRHALRRIAQNSLVTIAFILITGDPSATTDLIGGIPFLLTDLAWSRSFEREADDYALEYMRQRGLEPQHFAAIMKRLECSYLATDQTGQPSRAFQNCLQADSSSEDADRGWSSYLSSHPSTDDRIVRFLQFGSGIGEDPS